MKYNIIFALGVLLTVLSVNSCVPSGGSLNLDNGPSPAGAPATNRSAERPGLATGWGDEKKSEIFQSSFIRASSKPSGIDSIYYNDPKGIEAMTRHTVRINPLQTAAGGLVEWGIKGGIGFLATYNEGGYGRRLVSGKKDSTYSIFVRNRCESSLEIVASVDGLDVQDGQPASFSKRGYIVSPGKTLEIEGFRTSYRRVAAFRFSSVSNSYANMRHGNTRNVGVIGIAVFTQKNVNPWTWTPEEASRRDSAQPFATAP